MNILAHKWLLPVLITLVAVIILVAVLATRSPDTSPTLEELTAMAETLGTSEVQSYRATWSATSNNSGIITASSQETAFSAPDRYYLKTTEGKDISEFIVIGDTQYVKSGGFSPTQMVAFTMSASRILSTASSLSLIGSLAEPEALPREKIEGVDCLHYRGPYDMERQWEEMTSTLDPSQPGYEERLEMLEHELETMRQTTINYELWIGRDDLLLRRMEHSGQVPSEDTGQWVSINSTAKFYDINEPVIIEPPLDASGGPLPGWQLAEDYTPGISFTGKLDYEITGEDLAHRQVNLKFTVTNVGTEMATNVQVALHRIITPDYEEAESWINTEPSVPGQVDLKPRESETFTGNYECNTSRFAEEKFIELVGMTRARITYTTPAGHEDVEFISGGAPYPKAVPPEPPPTD